MKSHDDADFEYVSVNCIICPSLVNDVDECALVGFVEVHDGFHWHLVWAHGLSTLGAFEVAL